MGWSEWVRAAEVEPSIYGADFSRLGEQIGALLRAGCRVFHFDVGDGHFVEPITMGPIVLQSISGPIHDGGAYVDVHLMVEKPEKYFEPIVGAGGDSVTFHFEAVADVDATVRAAREHGLQAGVAFNPETEPEEVAAVAGGADLCLCMAIHPGYGGQEFRPETFERVRRLREAVGDGVHVQVDGGVGESNVRRLREEGATLFVAGTTIFHDADPTGVYRRLVAAIDQRA